MIKSILRKLYYIGHSIVINLFNRHVKVSLTARIKNNAHIEPYVKIGDYSYLDGNIDSFSYIGQNSIIYGTVGRFCSIGDNVKIVTAVHPTDLVSTSPCFYSSAKQCLISFTTNNEIREYATADDVKGCIIGNDVWVGSNVLIRGGVKVFTGAIIAMGSVVTKDVPPYAIVGGVPAKIIRYRFNEETRNKILASCWWKRDIKWFRDNRERLLNPEQFIKDV